MNFKFLSVLGAAGLCAASCVGISNDLGNGYIPIEQQYNVRTTEIPLSEVRNEYVSNLSGYSTRRICVGAIRDDLFGLCQKSSAFTLIPVYQSLDFGQDTQYKDFRISLQRDTVSVVDPAQQNIFQNINVYSLEDAAVSLDTARFTSSISLERFKNCQRISKGIPVYDGGDSLSFSFSKAYGSALLSKMISLGEDGVYDIDSLNHFTAQFPGIALSCEVPEGNGGRFNFFDVKINQDNGYVMGSYAELKFRAKYDGVQKDTSFLFMFGALDFPNLSKSSMPDQFAFNIEESEKPLAAGAAAGDVYISGGVGLKPVFPAEEIRDGIRAELAREGLNPNDSTIIINKATLIIPFKAPENYLDWNKYPTKLNPVCKIKVGDDSWTYANLTDSAISDENHGAIDRSNLAYTPDISFHTQKILWLRSEDGGDPTEEQYDNYDIWGLIIATETDVTNNSNSSSESDYYNQMMYYNYLNSMYGGYGGYGGYGYGGYGYGGYGGYGNYGYNNYYSMMMYYNMLNSSSSSSSTTSTSEELDKDRFYKAVLYGPSGERKPTLKLTYSYPKSEKK